MALSVPTDLIRSAYLGTPAGYLGSYYKSEFDDLMDQRFSPKYESSASFEDRIKRLQNMLENENSIVDSLFGSPDLDTIMEDATDFVYSIISGTASSSVLQTARQEIISQSKLVIETLSEEIRKESPNTRTSITIGLASNAIFTALSGFLIFVISIFLIFYSGSTSASSFKAFLVHLIRVLQNIVDSIP